MMRAKEISRLGIIFALLFFVIASCTNVPCLENDKIKANEASKKETIKSMPDVLHVHDGKIRKIFLSSTCKNEGLEAVKCSTCQKLLKFNALPLKKHTPTDWQVAQQPTCTLEGTKQIICANCGKILRTEKIPQVPHKSGDFQIAKTDGVMQYLEQRCISCDKLLDAMTRCIPINPNGLTIPAIGVDINLISLNRDTGTPAQFQEAVDAPHTGAYIVDGGVSYIADHNYQGFNKILNCRPGDVAYVYGQKITCYATSYGTNQGDLYLGDGSLAASYGGCIMYTCTDSSGRNIFITFWK